MIRIFLPEKPLSYNAYYRNTRTGKRVKTGKGLRYDEFLGVYLEGYEKALRSFGMSADSTKHCIKMTIQVSNSSFFVQDMSRMNKTAGDVDNVVKVLQDKLFKLAGIDDYMVKHLEVIQYPNTRDAAIIDLEFIPFPSIYTMNNLIDELK